MIDTILTYVRTWLMKCQTLRLLFNFSLPTRAFRLFITILAFSLQPSAFSQESVCAQVKIEIPQQLTLEREAFEATMTINNGVVGAALDNISVDVNFSLPATAESVSVK